MPTPDPAGWLRRLRKAVGPLPDSYLAFDLETTGLSPKDDLIVQIGYLQVEKGNPKSSAVAMLNWPGSGLVEANWLRHQLEKTRFNVEKNGATYRFTYDLLAEQGLPPLDVLRGFNQVVLESREAKRPLLTHNGFNFDLKFVEHSFKKFLDKAVCPAPSELIDTMWLERGIQGNVPLTGVKTLACLYGMSELRKPGQPKAKLHDHCAVRYNLVAPEEFNRAHDGMWDSIVTARLYEIYRRLSEEPNAEVGNRPGPGNSGGPDAGAAVAT